MRSGLIPESNRALRLIASAVCGSSVKCRAEAKRAARKQTLEYKAKAAAYEQLPEVKAQTAARHQTPEYKAKAAARRQTPEFKAKRAEYMRLKRAAAVEAAPVI